MAETQAEIRAGIYTFIKYMMAKGIDIEKMMAVDDVDLCMEQINNARMLNLDLDIYLNMCKFLMREEVIRLTTTSKKVIDKYYSHIWGYLQSIHYPKSLIPYNNYIDIRHAISMDQYHFWLLKNNHILDSFDQFDALHLDETNFKLSCNHCNTDSIDNLDPILNDFLKDFRFNSILDINGVKYFTLKPEVDCRIYGLDPVSDVVKTEIKRKWVTGEYTTDEIYVFDDSEYDENDPNFIYEQVAPDHFVKYRIRPPYC